MGQQIIHLRRGFLVAVLVLPWVYPFAGGPSPAVLPWLITVACVASVAWLKEERVALQARTVAAGWLLAALLSSVVGLLQYSGMGSTMAPWINVTGAGEAFANLRQRNHFATLSNIGQLCLLWYLATTWGNRERAPVAAVLLHVAAAVLAWGNAASSSRTGILALLVLCALALLWSRRQQAPIRRLLWTMLASYGVAAVCLPLLLGWSPFGHGVLERIGNDEAVCTSRLILWRNVLYLISVRPWQGWGWGELDYAHFMTLYEGPRFCEILGNAHNLPLHLAVELGLPVAVLVCSAIVWLVWRAKPWQERDPTRQLAWGVLALIALHSMLEYPLWYGPFQMAVGLCLGLLWRPSSAASMLAAKSGGMQVLRVGALLALLGVAYAAWDYRRVSQIYLAPEQRAAAYRDHTLEKIQDSWLFRDQVRFAQLSLSPVTPQNALRLNALAHELLHFSPEARVVEKLIESALLLGRDDEAQAFMQRYQAAYPQANAQWADRRRP